MVESPGQDTTPATQLQEALAENPLHADDRLQDNDSAYNASIGSASFGTSLASSILNFKYENGRRYHAFREGTYLVPNDEEEQERMDLLHHIFRLILGGELFVAPISDKVQRVLDLGTGTGIWAMDFADQFPSAEVIVDDFESDWPYQKPFDYIHARELEGCVGDYDQLFRQAHQHLAPGGYIELQAAYTRFLSDDDTAKKAVDTEFWLKTLIDGMAQFGKPLDCAIEWKEKLEAAGFVDVQQDIRKVPIGSWPKDPKFKELGTYQGIQQIKAVESYTPAVFTRVLGWSDEEIQVFIGKVRRDLRDPGIHLYIPAYFVWGRKAE